MFPGTFCISMAGLTALAEELGVTVDWLVENLSYDVQSYRYTDDGFDNPYDGGVMFSRHGIFGISDDASVAAVGMEFYEDTVGAFAGTVFILRDSDGDGNYIKAQRIDSPYPDNTANRFGHTVTISADGQLLLASARQGDISGGATDVGTVHVYKDSNGTFVEKQTIEPTWGLSASDDFGSTIALSADKKYVVIGSWGADSDGSNAGSVHFFKDSAGTFVRTQTYYASEGTSGALVYLGNEGSSINEDGTISLVSARNSDKVLRLERTGETWAETQVISNPQGTTGDQFGKDTQISRDGSFAVITASAEDSHGAEAGAAYYYEESAGEFAYRKDLLSITPSEYAEAYDTITSVSISADNNVIAVSGPGNSNDDTNVGKLHIYQKDSTGEHVHVKSIVGNWMQGDIEIGFARDNAISGDGNVIFTGFDHAGSTTTTDGLSPFTIFFKSDGPYKPDLRTSSVTSITSSEFAAGDFFGRYFDTNYNGDKIIVGAYGEQGGVGDPITDTGSAYYFVDSEGTWVEKQIIRNPGGGASENFGFGCAMDGTGDRIAISAAYASTAGEVKIFRDSEGTYVLEQTLDGTTEGFSSGSPFGQHMHNAFDSDGLRLLCGTGAHDSDGASNSGTVKVFTRSGTTWTQEASLSLLASELGADDQFGISYAMSGDGSYAIVGAYGDDGPSNATSFSGAAYIFSRSGTTWSESALLRSPDQSASDGFGLYTAINGDGTVAVVGAYYDEVSTTNSGAAYIYTRSGATWSLAQTLEPHNHADMANDEFGRSVTISRDGNMIAISAPEADYTAGTENYGAVYLYERNLNGVWDQVAFLRALHVDGVVDAWVQNDDLGRTGLRMSGNGKILVASGDSTNFDNAIIFKSL